MIKQTGAWLLPLVLAAAQATAAADEDGAKLLAQGQFAEAAAAFDLCLAQANSQRTAKLAIQCLLGQGSARIMQGELVQAQSSLEQALALAQSEADNQAERSAQLALGKLATYQARFGPADDFFDQVLASAQADNSSADRTRAWLGKADNAAEQLNRAAYRQALEQATESALDVDDADLRLALELAVAESLLRSDLRMSLMNWDLNLGSRVASSALKLAQGKANSYQIAYAAGVLGEFYLRGEQTAEAMQLARLAVFHAQQADAPELSYRWQWLLGRTLRTDGQWVESGGALERALLDLSQVRSGLLNGIRGRRQPFRELVGPLFQDHADVLLTQAATASDAQAQQLRARARTVIEAFKSAEMQDYFLDECVVDLEQKDTALDLIDPATAVLYPILLKDRTELLLSIGGHIHQFTVDASEDQVARIAVQFRRGLERRSSHRYKVQATRLYQWLVEPAEQVMAAAGINTLVFVPDGALRTVPLAAFYDGEKFLIERFAIATTPGLSLTDPKPIARQAPRILINGLTDAVQGFPALPSVEAELDSLASLYGDDITLLKNQSFVVSNIEEEMTQRPYDVVHFASHGEFQADVSQSFLLTYNEKLSMNQLDDFMQLRRFSDEPVELLTLSACKTAAGDDRAALGLAGIAIRAGARSALGTLWYINDKATSELITDFYGYLRDPGNSKAQALRMAQLDLVGDRRYNHPGYWAPFLLIGNWL